MGSLPLERIENVTEWRSPDKGSGDRREAPSRRLPAAVWIAELRPDNSAASSAFSKLRQDRHSVGCRLGVGVGDHYEVALRARDAAVDVRPEAPWVLVFQQP